VDQSLVALVAAQQTEKPRHVFSCFARRVKSTSVWPDNKHFGSVYVAMLFFHREKRSGWKSERWRTLRCIAPEINPEGIRRNILDNEANPILIDPGKLLGLISHTDFRAYVGKRWACL